MKFPFFPLVGSNTGFRTTCVSVLVGRLVRPLVFIPFSKRCSLLLIDSASNSIVLMLDINLTSVWGYEALLMRVCLRVSASTGGL